MFRKLLTERNNYNFFIQKHTLHFDKMNNSNKAEIFVETDLECYVQHYSMNITVATPGQNNVIYLSKGRHKLRFEAKNDSRVFEEIVYEVPDVPYTDFLDIKLFEIYKNKKQEDKKEQEIQIIKLKKEQYLHQERLNKMILCPRIKRCAFLRTYGYVDKFGNEVIPSIYSEACHFSEGLAAVKKSKWGYIDKEGNQIVPFEYDSAESFHNGIARVAKNIYLSNNRYYYIDKTGKFLYEELGKGEGLITVKRGKCGYIDYTGKIVIHLKYEDAGRFSEGLAPVKKNGKWGYIDKDDNVVIPFQYLEALSFWNGFATVKEKDGHKSSNVYGFINKEGQLISSNISSRRLFFSEGVAAKYDSGRSIYWYIDETGNRVSPYKTYEWAWEFQNGFARVKKYGKWGIIDKKGSEIVPFLYDLIYNCSLESPNLVELNGKYGYIDVYGKIVIPIIYDEATFFKEGFAKVRIDGNYYVIDKEGNIVYENKPSNLFEYTEGLAAVELNGKWGFVNTNGEEIISLEYDNVCAFIGGLAAVKKNGKWGVIDNSNKIIVPLIYDKLFSFTDGIAQMKKNEKWGFVDDKGIEIVEAKYDEEMSFCEGLSKVRIRDKWGLCPFIHGGLCRCQAKWQVGLYK